MTSSPSSCGPCRPRWLLEGWRADRCGICLLPRTTMLGEHGEPRRVGDRIADETRRPVQPKRCGRQQLAVRRLAREGIGHEPQRRVQGTRKDRRRARKRQSGPSPAGKRGPACSGPCLTTCLVSEPARRSRRVVDTRTSAVVTVLSTLICEEPRRRPLSVTGFGSSRPLVSGRRGGRTTHGPDLPDRCSWRATSGTVPAFARAAPRGR